MCPPTAAFVNAAAGAAHVPIRRTKRFRGPVKALGPSNHLFPVKLVSGEWIRFATLQFEKRQQGARVVMRVPVEVQGTAVDRNSVGESTHAGVVGVLVAMIRTSRKLQIGTEVELTNRFSQRTATFRVARVSDQR